MLRPSDVGAGDDVRVGDGVLVGVGGRVAAGLGRAVELVTDGVGPRVGVVVDVGDDDAVAADGLGLASGTPEPQAAVRTATTTRTPFTNTPPRPVSIVHDA